MGTLVCGLIVLYNYNDYCIHYNYSITSAHPFSGSEKNMISLFEKSHQVLEQMQTRLAYTTPDMRYYYYPSLHYPTACVIIDLEKWRKGSCFFDLFDSSMPCTQLEASK